MARTRSDKWGPFFPAVCALISGVMAVVDGSYWYLFLAVVFAVLAFAGFTSEEDTDAPEVMKANFIVVGIGIVVLIVYLLA